MKWIKISSPNIYACSECKQTVVTDDIEAYKYCHHCGEKVAEELVLLGKTIKDIEVDGCMVFIEFTDGYIFSYSASDGGYSTWGIYENREAWDYEE